MVFPRSRRRRRGLFGVDGVGGVGDGEEGGMGLEKLGFGFCFDVSSHPTSSSARSLA